MNNDTSAWGKNSINSPVEDWISNFSTNNKTIRNNSENKKLNDSKPPINNNNNNNDNSNSINCPLCSQSFPSDIIETHASTCNGVSITSIDSTAATNINANSSSPSSSSSNTFFSPALSSVPSLYKIQCLPPSKPNKLLSSIDELKILTYNIWFESICMQQRMEAIGSIIEYEQPDIICLQEVTEDSLNLIHKSKWIQSYYMTQPSLAPYFTLIFTRFQPLHSFRLPFISEMARDLLTFIISIPTSKGIEYLTIATSHLESEYRRKASRRHQLESAFKFLSFESQTTSTGIFCGDMNLVGSECSDIANSFGWKDSWILFHPTNRGSEKAGATMDSFNNTMIRKKNSDKQNNSYQARLDRIWLRNSNHEPFLK
jgi:endonuclease/exonuclease/phosphatase family metal-dependent hydrolase